MSGPDVQEAHARPRGAEDVTGKSKHGIARRSVGALAFRVMTAVSDTLVVVVTARGFGAEGRGLYAIASLAGSIIITTLGGTSTALAGEWAHRRATLGRLYASAVVIALVGGAVVGLGLGAAVAISWPDAKVLLFPAVAAPFLILNILQTNQFVATEDMRSYQWVILSTSVVPLVGLTIAAFAAPGEPYTALTVWTVCLAVVPLATLLVQRRRARFDATHIGAVVKRLLRRGMPVSLANGVQLLNYRVDLIVVTAMLPLADVGRYSVAIAIGESLLITSRSLGAASFGAIGNASEARAATITVRAVRHSLLLLTVTALAILVAGKLVLGPVFGSSFADAWLPLAVLLPGLIALGAGEQFRPFFLVRLERSREYLLAASAAMVINLVLAIALIPPLGLAGAALATTISYFVGGVYLAARFLARRDDLSAQSFVPTRGDVVDYARLIRGIARRLPGRTSRAG
jgi:O-antigen/teichoic acid export membrane protein